MYTYIYIYIYICIYICWHAAATPHALGIYTLGHAVATERMLLLADKHSSRSIRFVAAACQRQRRMLLLADKHADRQQ